ncbi:MAG: RDD family protein [Methylococcales bacterium]|nr:RDD family protein [Methylococcales bacterium]
MSQVSLLRRLAAVFYDALVCLSVLFFAAGLAIALHGGQAFTGDDYIFRAYLLVIAFFYYGGFWVYGGQTIGLKAWKLKLVGLSSAPVTWRQVVLRFLGAAVSLAALGLGFFWVLIDRRRLAWHDYLSKTRLVCIRS